MTTFDALSETESTYTRRGFLSGSSALASGVLLAEAAATQAQSATAAAASGGSANTTEATAAVTWDLVAANRILAAHEVVDGYGHVSARSPSNSERYLMSAYLAPEAVTADDLVELDLDSNPVDGRARRLQGERFIHGAIFRARPDVQAVIHFHAPPTVLMSVVAEPLRPVYHMAGFIGQGVPLFEIRNVAGVNTNLLISNLMLGHALAEALGDKPAILLRGHGAVVVGSTLPEAVGRAVYLTINAQLQGQLLGRKIEFLAPEEARLADSQNGYPKDWELWKAKAMAGYR